MSNITGDGESFSSENNTGGGVDHEVQQLRGPQAAASQPPSPPVKKKRNLPGTPGNLFYFILTSCITSRNFNV